MQPVQTKPASDWKNAMSCEPIDFTEAKITMETMLAIIAYSIAVAPPLARAKRVRADRATSGRAADRPAASDIAGGPKGAPI